MRLFRRVLLLAIVSSLVALGACKPAKDAKPADAATSGPVAANVNGHAISQRTVDLIVKQGATAGRPDTPETRKSVIDQLALQIVVADEAVRKAWTGRPRSWSSWT
jgi:peptidyl-prolyl cis-trans isomerase C